MKRFAGIFLLAAMLIAPLHVQAQAVAPGGMCPARTDVIALEKDMDGLTGELAGLTDTLQDPAQKAAAVKVQEHLAQVTHRVRQLQEKMDGAGSGMMVSAKPADTSAATGIQK